MWLLARASVAIHVLVVVNVLLTCCANRPSALATDTLAVHPKGALHHVEGRRHSRHQVGQVLRPNDQDTNASHEFLIENPFFREKHIDSDSSALLEANQQRHTSGPDRAHRKVEHRERAAGRGTQHGAHKTAHRETEALQEALDLAVVEDVLGPGSPKDAPWPSPEKAAMAYAATTSVALVTCALAMLAYMSFWPFSLISGDDVSVRERVQGYCLSDRFFGNFIYSIVLPDSLGLSSSMSQGATYSGWIIGIYKGLSLFGLAFGLLLCSVRNKAWIRNIYPCIVTGKVMAFVGSLMFLFIVVYRDTVPHAKHWLLLSRAVAGIGNGIVMIPVELIFVHTTTVEQRPLMLSLAVFNVTLGIGLGPLVASFTRSLYTAVSGEFQGEIEAVMALPVVVSLVGLLAVFFIPGAHEYFLESATVEDQTSFAEAAENFDEKPDYSARRIGIISCALIVGIRAAICAGLEAATAMILERDYSWTKNSVGIAIGLSFMVSVPGRFIYMYLKDIVGLVDQIRVNMGASFVASVFLFKTVQNVISMGNGGSPGWLLSAGSILYCAIYQVSGLVEGIMTTFALPAGSWFTVDNVILLKLICLDSIGRTFGPPLARMQVEAGGPESGQDCYAWQQMAMTLATSLLSEALLIRSMVEIRRLTTDYASDSLLPKAELRGPAPRPRLRASETAIGSGRPQPAAGLEASELCADAGLEPPTPDAKGAVADDTDA